MLAQVNVGELEVIRYDPSVGWEAGEAPQKSTEFSTWTLPHRVLAHPGTLCPGPTTMDLKQDKWSWRVNVLI